MEEIRIAKVYDKDGEASKVEFFDSISYDEFQLVKSSILEIEELYNIRRLFNFVNINDKEFIEFLQLTLKDLTTKSFKWNGVSQEDCDNVYLNVNRLFLNYLSAIRTFLDHSETYLNRKFGESSKTFLDFKKILSFFYDNSFSYRFFYRLRNYAQHVGLPIDGLEFKTKYYKKNDSVNGTLNVKFDRDKLISKYSKWSTVKSELELMDDKFDVAPLVFEMTQNIRDIKKCIEMLQKNELNDAADYILSLTNHLRNDNGKIFIVDEFVLTENGKLTNYSTTEIPFETIDYIKSELN